MSDAVEQLWTIAGVLSYVDAQTLAGAIEAAVEDEAVLDYRSHLLVCDSVSALRSLWNGRRFDAWLQRSPQRRRIERTCAIARYQSAVDHDDRGFPSLRRRVVDATKPQTIMRFFRELSARVHNPTRMVIGGAAALILGNYGARQTDHIAVVDETPAGLRHRHDVLDDLADRFGLRLSEFPSYYLPDGWQRRPS